MRSFCLMALSSVVLIACGGSRTPDTRNLASENLGLASKLPKGQTHCEIPAYRSPATGLSLSLLSERDVGFDRRMAGIREQLPKGVQAYPAGDDPYQIDQEGSYHIPLHFSLESEPLCSWQFYASAHDTAEGIWLKGRVPASNLSQLRRDLNSQDLGPRFSLRTVLEERLNKKIADLSANQNASCVMEKDGILRRAQQYTVSLDDEAYELALVDGKIERFDPLFLQASGKFRTVEAGSSATNVLSEVLVEGIDDNGYLCSPYFTINTAGDELTYSKDLDFRFESNDPRFRESSLFANASQMMSWFLSFDPSAHWSQAQVELQITESEQSRMKGPLYNSPEGSKSLKRPIIVVPVSALGASAAEKSPDLINLTTDFDVVAHELSHHIVSQYVGFSAAPENRMIHEGLADFFVHAKTGNSCLGESICIAGAKICQVASSCLRSSEILLSVKDPTYDSLQPHRKSIVVSGLLWDVGSGELGLRETARLTMQALRYLDRTTNISDLMSALFQADRQLFNGENSCAIEAAAVKRGIEISDAEAGCNN